jgi:hypothetical protein
MMMIPAAAIAVAVAAMPAAVAAEKTAQAAAAATAVAAAAAVARQGRVVSTQQGNADHREEDRDAENQCSIHLWILHISGTHVSRRSRLKLLAVR